MNDIFAWNKKKKTKRREDKPLITQIVFHLEIVCP